MQKMKKSLVFILSLSMMGTMITNTAIVSAQGDSAPQAPTGLMINQSNEPLGVETASPVFSWVVNDLDKNETQTAYQIMIATTQQKLDAGTPDVWDSGRVASSESSNVAYSGSAMPQNSKYYWTVRTWDKDGLAGPYAAPQFFTTGAGSQWDASAIWDNPGGAQTAPSFASQGFTDYTVECDFRITSTAVGFILRKPTNNGNEDQEYMFQINTSSLLRPHIFYGSGSYSTPSPTDLKSFGITINANETHHVKFSLAGASIQVEVDHIVVASYTMNDYLSGTFGFRCSSGESAVISNLSVKKPDGTALYSDNFAAGQNPFSGGTVQGGALVVPQSSVAVYGLSDSVFAAKGYVNYSYECDFVITSAAIGFCIRHTTTDCGQDNMYMLQVNTSSQFRPHIATSYPTLDSAGVVDLKTYGITINANETHHIKISAVGGTLQTWIDSKLVSTLSYSNFSSGTFGLRCGGGESGYIDNLKVYKTDGTMLYQDDFSSGYNPFTGGGSAENGHLTAHENECFYYGTYKDNVVFLRREFNVTKTVEKAVVSAIGKDPDSLHDYTFKLYLNGNYAGAGSPRPLNDGVHQNVYNTFDVTSLMKSGTNCIGAICYSTGSDKRFQMQMKIYYTDGTFDTLVTDSTWKSLDGTNIYGDNGVGLGGVVYIMSENIDARVFPYGWNEAGYNDGAWNTAAVKDTITGLSSSPIEGMKEYEMPATEVIDKGNGDYFIKLDKEIIGSLRLTLPSGVAGNRMTVLYGEQATVDHSVIWQTAALNQYREYWTMKDGPQVFEGWGIKAFRYIELQNCPVPITADMVKGIAMRQAFDESDSSFTSSNQVLNDVWELCKYTIQGTNQDMYVDSQTRERANYAGDDYINQISSYAVSRNYNLARYSAAWAIFNPTWPTEYTMLNVLSAWDDYMYTGNPGYISAYYDKIKTELNENWIDSTGLFTTNARGWNSDMIDWPVNVRDGYNVGDCYYNTAINCYEYAAINAVVQMAQMLGKTDDATHYTAVAAALRQNINTRLYNTQGDGLYIEGMKKDGTLVTGHAIATSIYPLLFGVAPDAARQKLADTIEAAGMKGGVYTAQFQLQALYAAGKADAALGLMSATNVTSWGNMIYNLDCTMTCEAFDPSINSGVSFSHPWSTAPSNNIVQGMFGVVPLEKAFGKIQIKPQTGFLSQASLTTPTVKGAVSVSVNPSAAGSTFAMTTDTPANTTAKVYMPARGVSHNIVLVDGTAVQAARDGDYLVLDNVGSGEHTFTVPQSSVIIDSGIAHGSVSVSPASPLPGDTVTVTATPESGWGLVPGSLKQNGTAIAQNSGVFQFTMPDTLVTITAQFEQLATETVAFDVNGGDISTKPASQSVTAGSLAAKPAAPSHMGYDFAGWNTKADGSGTVWDYAAMPVPTGGVTLFAQWRKSAFLRGTEPGATAATLAQSLVQAGLAVSTDGVAVKDSGGTVLTGTAAVGTGMTVTAGANSWSLVITGDLDGDGNIGSTDLLLLKRQLLGLSQPANAAAAAAANIDRDASGNISSTDLLLLKRHLLGLSAISQRP